MVIKKKIREGTGMKVVTLIKLVTRLSILLVQIKAGNISYKLRSEIRQTLHILYQHNKIPKTLYNILIESLQQGEWLLKTIIS